MMVGQINQPTLFNAFSATQPMTPSRDSMTHTTSRIFRAIWRRPHITRVALADRLGLDKSTVTNQVNALIDLGLIVEIEEGSASVKGGRRPIHLGINKSFGRIIGLEVQADSYIALAVDLAGEIQAECRGSLELTAETLPDTVTRLVGEVSDKLGKDGAPLLGVGIGSGGLIDSKRGIIRYSVPLDIKEPLNFGKLVSPRIAVPCFIENDANCCAWGELAFNRSEDLREFLFALVEYRKGFTSVGSQGGLGVGFGVVLGGKVHSGIHGTAGEFRSAFCEGVGDLQFSLSKAELSRFGSDPEVLHRASDELARNMALLVNTMDFERVFVGGDIETLPIDFPALLRRRLEENWMYPFPKGVEIRNSSLGERAVAFGAAGMILDRLVTENLLPVLGRNHSGVAGSRN